MNQILEQADIPYQLNVRSKQAMPLSHKWKSSLLHTIVVYYSFHNIIIQFLLNK